MKEPTVPSFVPFSAFLTILATIFFQTEFAVDFEGLFPLHIHFAWFLLVMCCGGGNSSQMITASPW